MGRRSSSSHSGSNGGRPPDPVEISGDLRTDGLRMPPMVENMSSAGLNKARRRPSAQLAGTKETGIGKPGWKNDGKSRKGKKANKVMPMEAEDYDNEEFEDIGEGDEEIASTKGDGSAEVHIDNRYRNSFGVLGHEFDFEEGAPIVPQGNTANLSKNWENNNVDANAISNNIHLESIVNDMVNLNENLKVTVDDNENGVDRVVDIRVNSVQNIDEGTGWRNINPDSDFVKGQGFEFLRRLEKDNQGRVSMKAVRHDGDNKFADGNEGDGKDTGGFNVQGDRERGRGGLSMQEGHKIGGENDKSNADKEGPISGSVPVTSNAVKDNTTSGSENVTCNAAKEDLVGNKGQAKVQGNVSGTVQGTVINHINNDVSILGDGSKVKGDGQDVEMKQAEEASHEGSKARSYAGALNGRIHRGKLQIKYYPSPVGKENEPAELPMENLMHASLPFRNTLYGYVLDKRISFPVLSKELRKLWSFAGLEDVFMNNKGFIFFKFCNEQGLNQVLENSPWLIFNTIPIFLQRWRPGLALTKNVHDKIPVWIKIYDLPLEAWSGDNLCIIASKIGIPLAFDSFTEDMCIEHKGRSAYARILVDMSADREWRDRVEVQSWDFVCNRATVQSCGVEYSWRPSRCSNCKVFGHGDKACPVLIAKKNELAKASKEGAGETVVERMVSEDGFTMVQKKGNKGGKNVASTSGTKDDHGGYYKEGPNNNYQKGTYGNNGSNNRNRNYGGWNGRSKNGNWKSHGGNQGQKGVQINEGIDKGSVGVEQVYQQQQAGGKMNSKNSKGESFDGSKVSILKRPVDTHSGKLNGLNNRFEVLNEIPADVREGNSSEADQMGSKRVVLEKMEDVMREEITSRVVSGSYVGADDDGLLKDPGAVKYSSVGSDVEVDEEIMMDDVPVSANKNGNDGNHGSKAIPMASGGENANPNTCFQ